MGSRPHELDCLTLYDLELLAEVSNEKYEFQLFNTREIIYWQTNSVPERKTHLEREKIMQLPSEKEKVDYVALFNTQFAEEQLKKISELQNKSTQQL